MKTALIIPVYIKQPSLNPDSLYPLIDKIREFIRPEHIFIIDDGSIEGALDSLSGESCRIVRHPVNLGKGKALQSGFKAASEAGYDWGITLDADGQHAPEHLPAFIEKAESGDYGLIAGSRRSDMSGMPLDRRFSNLTTSFILSVISGRKILDAQCGYRMYNLNFVNRLEFKTSGFDTENELLLAAFRKNINIGWVDIKTIYGNENSHIDRASDTMKFIKLIIKHILGRKY